MKKEGFPRKERIVKKETFQEVFKKGMRLKTDAFQLHFLPKDSPSRIGIIASRKTGNAAIRNRGKRIFRDIFRRNKDLIPSGYIVVRLSSKFSSRSYADLKDSFIENLSSISDKNLK